MASSILYFLSVLQSLWCIRATSQTTTLPPPHEYTEGLFTNPNTTVTQIYTAGSSMIVSWEGAFESTTIYLIFGEDYNSPRVLISGTSESSFQWSIDDHGNNSLPFALRAVDALGSVSDKQGKGFLSGAFWIKNESKSSSLSSISSSTTSQGTSVAETTTGSQISKSEPNQTILNETGPTPTSLNRELSEVLLSATTPPKTSGVEATTTEATTQSEQPSNSTPAHSLNVTAIGVGAGLGSLLVIVIATLVAIFLLRRRQHRRRSDQPHCTSPRSSTSRYREEKTFPVSHTKEVGSWGVKHDLCGCSANGFVEAPNNQGVPHELDGAHFSSSTCHSR